ncbi:MAG: hypothetical protein H7268_06600 [Sandarakinorhabdus sp.]|nr:hypothetical protein [Sandarakinorhabdus sp.]
MKFRIATNAACHARSIGLLMMVAIAAATSPAQAATTPLAGNWAGDNFSLRVIRGGAMVQGKCVNGKITSPILVDGKGHFVASGYFNPVTSGFRVSDVSPRDQPAKFIGQVNGDKLELKLQADGISGPTSFKLQQGKTIKFADCGRDTRYRLN